MSFRLLILGAGSQGRVVADCAQALGWEVAGYVDLGMEPDRVGTKMLGIPIVGVLSDLPALAKLHKADVAHAAIGHCETRLKLIKQAQEAGLELPVIEHPTAYVSPHARLGDGCFVAAQAMIGPLAKLGIGCIVNTSASVDHDCVLGDCVHIAVGTHLAGNVEVGDLSTLGAGCAAIPGVKIGRNVTVGAGATVVKNLPDDCTAVGTPARPL